MGRIENLKGNYMSDAKLLRRYYHHMAYRARMYERLAELADKNGMKDFSMFEPLEIELTGAEPKTLESNGGKDSRVQAPGKPSESKQATPEIMALARTFTELFPKDFDTLSATDAMNRAYYFHAMKKINVHNPLVLAFAFNADQLKAFNEKQSLATVLGKAMNGKGELKLNEMELNTIANLDENQKAELVSQARLFIEAYPEQVKGLNEQQALEKVIWMFLHSEIELKVSGTIFKPDSPLIQSVTKT